MLIVGISVLAFMVLVREIVRLPLPEMFPGRNGELHATREIVSSAKNQAIMREEGGRRMKASNFN